MQLTESLDCRALILCGGAALASLQLAARGP